MAETFDLASLFERDDVKRIDGSKMEIRHKQELSIMQRHQLDALIATINELDGKPDKTEADAQQGSKLLHDLAAIVVVDCPDDLEDWECASVFAFWLARAMQDTPAGPPPRSRGSKKSASSPGSKRSTAATRKGGSTGRRGS